MLKMWKKIPTLGRLMEEGRDLGKILSSSLWQITVFKGRKYDLPNYDKHLECHVKAVIVSTPKNILAAENINVAQFYGIGR
jgi:hypothetical protein